MSTRIEKKNNFTHTPICNLHLLIYPWKAHYNKFVNFFSLFSRKKIYIFIQWSIGCSYIHLVRNAEKSFVSSQQVNKIFKIETFWHKPVSPLHQNWTEPWLHRVYAGKSQFRCFAPLRGHGRQAHTGTG